jgi:hypothetical protein
MRQRGRAQVELGGSTAAWRTSAVSIWWRTRRARAKDQGLDVASIDELALANFAGQIVVLGAGDGQFGLHPHQSVDLGGIASSAI